MYCKHCGIEIEDTVAFCPHCGKATADATTTDSISKKKAKAPFVIVIALICIIAVAAVGIFSKQSADAQRAEEEALAASIAESESIAESIAQAEAAAESLAQAEALAAEEARNQYIENLNNFVALSTDGFSISQEICNFVYMVWYDTVFGQYREETAAYTMTDGVFHATVDESFDAITQSEELYQMFINLEANKQEVSRVFQLLSNPTEEFTKCYEAAEKLLDAYVKLYTHAELPSGDLQSYADKYEEFSDYYIENHERIKMLIPNS